MLLDQEKPFGTAIYFAVTFLLLGYLIILSPSLNSESQRSPNQPLSNISKPMMDGKYGLLKSNVKAVSDGKDVKIPYYKVRTNSEGLRDENFSKKKPNDTYRILAVGDSFTFGWGVNESDRFTEILEKDLNEKFGNIEVINAGIPGSAMDGYYYRLREVGLDYNPDMVIIVFNRGDKLTHSKETEFRKKAERLVPSNISNRKEKVRNKRVELKTRYARNAPIWNSSIKTYMRKIINLSHQKKFNLIFYTYNLHSSTENDQFRRIIKNESELILAPKKFAKHREEEYTLHREDPHYNQKGNLWLAEKLYSYLHTHPDIISS